MKNVKKRIAFGIAFFCTVFLFAEEKSVLFRFCFNQGDKSRILSTVNEDVYLNGRFNHNSIILNRISSEVVSVGKNGEGECNVTFMTSENATSIGEKNLYTWGEEYHSVFTRDELGKYTISDEYFMPTVRDVPVFPEYEVSPGDSWTSEGHEAHDMRRTFGVQKPFKVPFTADYTYVGDVTNENGVLLNEIHIQYELDFESPADAGITYRNIDYSNLPYRTSGFSKQKVFWNNERGQIDHYSEEFTITIETFIGDKIVFTGTAHAEVTDFERSSTKENLERISDTVAKLGLENVDVKESEQGLTISIENIQFQPDSAVLMPLEKVKLEKIAEILKTFSNDLLITGHCANRGTLKNQQRISEERAASVAGFLSSLNVREPNCIFTQGKGAKEPVASNATEAGRARNRRVEITIMDK